jgi:ABC-type Na+ efflux pump permease subunit
LQQELAQSAKPQKKGEALKISAQMSILMAIIFALIAFGVALTGYNAIGDMTEPQQIADAKGFAMFWAFLGCIAVIMCAISVWIMRTRKDSDGA